MRGKFDWQVLEYLVQRLLNIKIFKIYFLVLIFNNKPLDEQIKDFQIILITYKGLSIYYVIRDGGAGVFPIYYNIT